MTRTPPRTRTMRVPRRRRPSPRTRRCSTPRRRLSGHRKRRHAAPPPISAEAGLPRARRQTPAPRRASAARVRGTRRTPVARRGSAGCRGFRTRCNPRCQLARADCGGRIRLRESYKRPTVRSLRGQRMERLARSARRVALLQNWATRQTRRERRAPLKLATFDGPDQALGAGSCGGAGRADSGAIR